MQEEQGSKQEEISKGPLGNDVRQRTQKRSLAATPVFLIVLECRKKFSLDAIAATKPVNKRNSTE